MEVKCPFKHHGQTVEEACKDETFCCTLVDGCMKLKQDHSYYLQVQGQLASTGLHWCDFVVWLGSPEKMACKRIQLCHEFWFQVMLPGLTSFYHSHAKPFLEGLGLASRNMVSQLLVLQSPVNL